MFKRVREDIKTVFDRDPAARSILEVLLCYPGLHAIWLHRIGHWLWEHHLKLFGRILSHVGRFFTGIEIHPGAEIGRRFFIDHGMGVVIGETAEIGDDVLMYQGVVLGGTSLQKKKRHATIGDHVVMGAGAILLGPIEVGSDARIGAGSVVIRSVPDGATVVGVPGRTVDEKPSAEDMLHHADLPDPLSGIIHRLAAEQKELREQLESFERATATTGTREEFFDREPVGSLEDGAGI